ncbi:MAG: class I SAM-dependent methyltransferase [Planctomycetota bacterium]
MLPANATADPILSHLQLEPTALDRIELPDARREQARVLVERAGPRPLLVDLPGLPEDAELSRLRNALWPVLHISALFRTRADGRTLLVSHTERRVLEQAGSAPRTPRTTLLLRRRADAMGQDTTRAKFNANATGWNGAPGSPTYPHYRWMRRLIALHAQPLTGLTVLDAGCGTGWVGIEAGRLGGRVSAFDPSPAMVELARANAQQTGVELDARVGFVEGLPFEQPFDVVLNSGVISFAPDPEVYLERLDRLVKPGGLLVIGDINPLAQGFRRRRSRLPLLPARELGGLPRARVAELLAARGYRLEGQGYYQITFPVPQLMAISERKGRGFGCGLMLLANRAAAALDKATGSRGSRLFDSWLLRARKAPAA